MKINFKRQAGATLIEVIMVVALMAIITIGALTYYNSANEASKVNQAVSDLTSLSSTIRSTFASQGNYTGLDEELIYRMSTTSSNMKSTITDELKHPWSQHEDAVDIAISGTSDNTFSITYDLLPQGACQEIASRTHGRFDRIRVNSTTIEHDDIGAMAKIMGGTGCENNSENTLIFTQR